MTAKKSMRSRLCCKLLFAFLVAAQCHAATIDGKFTDLGDNFRDDETGTVWRKPSLSRANRSELYTKDWLEGYRFGLEDEVRALFANIDAEGNQHDLEYTESLQELLGYTVFSFAGRARSWFLADDGPPALMGLGTIDYFIDGDFANLQTEILSTGQFTHAAWAQPLMNGDIGDSYGAWLVAVPEPGTGVLLAIAGALLTAIGKRPHRSPADERLRL